jgi:hypothetical protein
VPEKQKIKSGHPKPFIFVAMPYSESFNQVYEAGIKKACELAGAYCERVDEQHYDGTVIERIFNQIAKADVVVCELTSRNPNVFYETGYAHALGKKTLLIASNSDDIPFDLQNFPIVVYGQSLDNLTLLLSEKIEWALQQDLAEFYDPLSAIRLFVNGSDVSDGQTIVIDSSEAFSDESLFLMKPIDDFVSFKIDLHNSLKRTISIEGLECHCVLPEALGVALDGRSFRESNGAFVFVSKLHGEMLPNGWASVDLLLNRNELGKNSIGIHQVKVGIVSQFGRVEKSICVSVK